MHLFNQQTRVQGKCGNFNLKHNYTKSQADVCALIVKQRQSVSDLQHDVNNKITQRVVYGIMVMIISNGLLMLLLTSLTPTKRNQLASCLCVYLCFQSVCCKWSWSAVQLISEKYCCYQYSSLAAIRQTWTNCFRSNNSSISVHTQALKLKDR